MLHGVTNLLNNIGKSFFSAYAQLEVLSGVDDVKNKLLIQWTEQKKDIEINLRRGLINRL